MKPPSPGNYFDYAATTPLLPEVAQWLAQPQLFGNPSSPHAMGRKAAELLARARASVAQDLGVEPTWVIFTASATESDNLAILGSAAAQQKARPQQAQHFIASRWEHPAVIEPLRRLQQGGAELSIVGSDSRSPLDLAAFKKELRPDTTLVSVMAVHNELGLRMPIQELGSILAEHPARFHCDGVQAMATQELRPQAMGIDLLTLTAHKMGGPKGIGVLVRDPELAIEPLCAGGGQESALRPGTENAHLAFAFALALRHTQQARSANLARYEKLRERLLSGLLAAFPGLRSAHELYPCAPNIVSVCLPGQQGAKLVAKLDRQEIYLSAGAACHSGAGGASPSALALGLSEELARGLIRISLGPQSEAAQVDALLAAISSGA